eukprot:5277501-Amphidinium_carterae.1
MWTNPFDIIDDGTSETTSEFGFGAITIFAVPFAMVRTCCSQEAKSLDPKTHGFTETDLEKPVDVAVAHQSQRT